MSLLLSEVGKEIPARLPALCQKKKKRVFQCNDAPRRRKKKKERVETGGVRCCPRMSGVTDGLEPAERCSGAQRALPSDGGTPRGCATRGCCWRGPARPRVPRLDFRSPFGASSVRGTLLFSAGNRLWVRKKWLVKRKRWGRGGSRAAGACWAVDHSTRVKSGLLQFHPSFSPTQNGLYYRIIES